MSERWELVIHGPTLDFLLSRRGTERVRILKFCDQLVANPYPTGDYQEKDLSGRSLQVRIVENWAITYWADHAVKELRVVRIQPA